MKTVQVMKPNLDNFLGLSLEKGLNVNMMLDTHELFISAKSNLIYINMLFGFYTFLPMEYG